MTPSKPLEETIPLETGGGKVRELSPKELVLYDVGKNLATDAIATGADFCKTMIGTSTGAIALYYALFTYLVPDKYEPADTVNLILFDVRMKVLILVPPLLFLVAASFFTYGYFAKTDTMDLNQLEKTSSSNGKSVEEIRESAIQHRSAASMKGVGAFLVGLACASLLVLSVASATPKQASPSVQKAIIVRSTGVTLCGDLLAGTVGGPLALLPQGEVGGDKAIPITDAVQVYVVAACP